MRQERAMVVAWKARWKAWMNMPNCYHRRKGVFFLFWTARIVSTWSRMVVANIRFLALVYGSALFTCAALLEAVMDEWDRVVLCNELSWRSENQLQELDQIHQKWSPFTARMRKTRKKLRPNCLPGSAPIGQMLHAIFAKSTRHHVNWPNGEVGLQEAIQVSTHYLHFHLPLSYVAVLSQHYHFPQPSILRPRNVFSAPALIDVCAGVSEFSTIPLFHFVIGWRRNRTRSGNWTSEVVFSGQARFQWWPLKVVNESLTRSESCSGPLGLLSLFFPARIGSHFLCTVTEQYKIDTGEIALLLLVMSSQSRKRFVRCKIDGNAAFGRGCEIKGLCMWADMITWSIAMDSLPAMDFNRHDARADFWRNVFAIPVVKPVQMSIYLRNLLRWYGRCRINGNFLLSISANFGTS